MRILFVLLGAIIITSCGGELSKEKRKAFQKEMKAREIRRVAEEDIVAETFKMGKALFKEFSENKDSLQNAVNANIYLLHPGDAIENAKDQELMEAYNYSAAQGTSMDANVQRDGEEMIYSVPKVQDEHLEGVYMIRIPRKQLVLEL